jgi:hypothetical protein
VRLHRGHVLLVVLLGASSASAQSHDSLITTKPLVVAAPACVRISSGRADMAPTPVSIVTPPTENIPRSMRGRTVGVRLLVSVGGRVDSIVMTGVPDSTYAAGMRESLRRYRFQPAHRNGCVVTDWYEFTITFPERR